MIFVYFSCVFEWNEDIVEIGSLGNNKPPCPSSCWRTSLYSTMSMKSVIQQRRYSKKLELFVIRERIGLKNSRRSVDYH